MQVTLQGWWQIMRLKLFNALKVKNLCFTPDRNQCTKCTEFSFLTFLSHIYPRKGRWTENQLKYSWSSLTAAFKFDFFSSDPLSVIKWSLWFSDLIWFLKNADHNVEKSSLDLVKRPNIFCYRGGGKVFWRLCVLYQYNTHNRKKKSFYGASCN